MMLVVFIGQSHRPLSPFFTASPLTSYSGVQHITNPTPTNSETHSHNPIRSFTSVIHSLLPHRRSHKNLYSHSLIRDQSQRVDSELSYLQEYQLKFSVYSVCFIRLKVSEVTQESRAVAQSRRNRSKKTKQYQIYNILPASWHIITTPRNKSWSSGTVYQH